MTRTRTVWLPPRLVAAIQREALRRERSVSTCVVRAWTMAWPRIAKLAAPTPVQQNREDTPLPPGHLVYTNPRAEAIFEERFAGGEREPLELVLSADLANELADESYRLARSLAWLLERAWCIALDVEVNAGWYRAGDFIGDTAPIPRYE